MSQTIKIHAHVNGVAIDPPLAIVSVSDPAWSHAVVANTLRVLADELEKSPYRDRPLFVTTSDN